MASFGAKNPRWAAIDTEPEGALPTYEAPLTIGRAIKMDRTIQFASGKLYADDTLAESVDEFVSATLAEETDDIMDEVAAAIYGATVESGRVRYRAGDNAPHGGHTYYKVLMRNGVKFFKGYFYPKVKAVMGNDTAQTKADSITFGTAATTFTVFRCNSDDWCITETFATEADCIAWCDEMLGGTAVKRYWGASEKETLTDAEILALESESASNRKQTKTFDCTGGRYFYVAYPAAWGEASFFINNLAYSDVEFETRDIDDGSGEAVTLNIYRSGNIQTGSDITVEVR